MFSLFNQSKDPRKLVDKALQTADPHKAVELYSDAIKIEKASKSPDLNFLSDLYLMRGEIYLDQGVAILSSSDFLQALEYNPKNGIAHNDLGLWFTIKHFSEPNFPRALEHLDQAIEYCPDRPDFKMNRACIKIEMGQKEIGRAELEQLYKDGYRDAKIAIEKLCK